MPNVDPAVIAHLNALAEERFKLQVASDEKDKTFKDQQAAQVAAHAADKAPLQAKMDEIDVELWELTTGHRSELIAPSRQSFTTGVARFQFTNKELRPKATDPKAIMKIARDQGFVRFVGKPIRRYEYDPSKLSAALSKLGSRVRKMLEPFIEMVGGETLSMKPNGSHVVVHDGKRLTPPSVSIKRPSPEPKS